MKNPGKDRHRIFVNDLNGPLYILNKKDKSFVTYLNFKGTMASSAYFTN